MQRRHRLSRSRDFDAVYRHGRSVSTRFLTLYWFAREEDGGEPRLGLSVPKKAVAGAVARNRIKRRLRELWRARLETLPPGRDYVLIVRPGLTEAAEERGARVARRARRRSTREGGGMTSLDPASALVSRDRPRLRVPLDVGPLLGNRCKYHPSCSQYALDALREYGFVKGSILAGWRLLRCNPWSHGGVDHAKDQRLFA